MGTWITIRFLLSYTPLKANGLTDIVSFAPSLVVAIQNSKNWIAGERTYTKLSAFDVTKREERILPVNERRKKNPVVPKELYAGNEPMFFFGKSAERYIGRKEYAEGHIICFGGSGTGKSSGVAIPTLYTWDGAILAIDIKGELYRTLYMPFCRGMPKVMWKKIIGLITHVAICPVCIYGHIRGI